MHIKIHLVRNPVTVKALWSSIFLISWYSVLSQTLTIEGSVKDKSTGEPLAFANVYLKETNFGTVTSQSGNFKLKFPNEKKEFSIRFSHMRPLHQ